MHDPLGNGWTVYQAFSKVFDQYFVFPAKRAQDDAAFRTPYDDGYIAAFGVPAAKPFLLQG